MFTKLLALLRNDALGCSVAPEGVTALRYLAIVGADVMQRAGYPESTISPLSEE